MEKHKQTRPYFWHQRTRTTAKTSVSRRLTLETLEDRLVLSTVLPYSQLGVTSSGNFPGGEATDAFDGTGLISPDLHNNLWNEGWLSDGGTPVGEWLKVDLGGTYDIDYLRVWNDNQAGLTTRGIKQADIYVALSDPGNNLNDSSQSFDPFGWTLVTAGQAFTKSPGGASIANTDPQISLGGAQAAFLAIRVNESWGDPQFVGLSEIQIYVDDASATTYPLVVNNGSGDGDYAQGATINVMADPAQQGQVFDTWTGDTSFLDDLLAPNTMFTMPAATATIAAAYRNLPTPDADFDSDSDVDGSDFLSWQRGFGTDAGTGNVAPLASGNANGDSLVDENDLTIWQQQFGQTSVANTGPANLALNKPVTVSGNLNATDVGTNAVDGLEDTLWRTPVTDPWIVVDLGQVYDNIDRVSMRYSRVTGYYATNFDIEYSLDNLSWSLAKNEPNGFHSTKVDILFDPVSARYIRYSINTLSHPTQGVRLDEIQVFQTRPLNELNRRDDAGNFFNKLEAGGVVNVAYMGGSITVQPDGWTEQSQDMIELMYPGVQITPFESAVGGTGTQAALGRVASVIASNPDLVFIEFAVNDGHNPYENNLANMEQLVRQIWTADPTTDILFVYTLRESAQVDLKDVDTLDSGYYQTMSAAAFEEVADYYGIPTIHMGKLIAEQAALGQIIMEGPTTSQGGIPVFASDGIHPYIETGHVWYTEALQRAFTTLGTNTTLFTHSLPASEIREASTASSAISTSAGGSSLAGLSLKSQQFSPTDEAFLLLPQTPLQKEIHPNPPLSSPQIQDALDLAFQQWEAFQQREQHPQETEQESADFTQQLASGLTEAIE